MEDNFKKIYATIQEIETDPAFLEHVIHYLQFRLGNCEGYDDYLKEATKSSNISVRLSSLNALATKQYANCDFTSCLQQKQLLKRSIQELVDAEKEIVKEADEPSKVEVVQEEEKKEPDSVSNDGSKSEAIVMLEKITKEIETLEKMISDFKTQMAKSA